MTALINIGQTRINHLIDDHDVLPSRVRNDTVGQHKELHNAKCNHGHTLADEVWDEP